MTREDWLMIAINAAVKAGQEIMDVYRSDFIVDSKEDDSPVTIADKNAHRIIVEVLSSTQLPILSEEGNIPDYAIRKNWNQFWMVDPLDGTKEFVQKNGEFTVNIALIEDCIPTMGIIYIPNTKALYFSDKLAYKVNNIEHTPIKIENILREGEQLPIFDKNEYVVLTSRSHLSKKTIGYIDSLRAKHPDLDILRKGSSLKLCLIAEGAAQIYPRFSPCMEWDIAAGHAIINAAGGSVLNWETKEPLVYNKKNLLNPWFGASGKAVL